MNKKYKILLGILAGIIVIAFIGIIIFQLKGHTEAPAYPPYTETSYTDTEINRGIIVCQQDENDLYCEHFCTHEEVLDSTSGCCDQDNTTPCVRISGVVSDPTETAKNALIERLNAPGTPVITDQVSFSKDNSLLNPETIIRGTSISSDQLCMSIGDYDKEENTFVISDKGVIEYVGYSSIDVKLVVVCDEARYIEDSFQLRCPGCNIEVCGEGELMPTQGIVCAIGLIKP